MKIKHFKSGKKKSSKLTVITGVHGDEGFLFKPIQHFLSNVRLPLDVDLVLANEEALKKDVRYIDSDLNRSFQLHSNSHEAKLAQKLMNDISGDIILDFHTHTSTEKFILVPKNSFCGKVQEVISHLPITKIVVLSPSLSAGSLVGSIRNSFSIEIGQHKSNAAINFALDVLKKVTDIMSDSKSDTLHNVKQKFYFGESFLMNTSGRSMKVSDTITNFKEIKKGDPISNNLISSENIIPVLVSYDVKKDAKVFMKCFNQKEVFECDSY